MKILVVDDSSTMRRIIINCLKTIGHEDIIQAEDGIDAELKMQINSGIELVLTDWNMPNKDGLALVKSIRGNDQYKAVPIIMITTEAEKTNVVTALKAGANNYIVKPFTSDILQAKLAQTLNKG